MLIAALNLGILCLALAMLCALHAHYLRVPVEIAERLLGKSSKGMLVRRAGIALQALADRPAFPEHRLLHLHAISGLPTREPLIARMTTDGSGTLALLSLKDYDRLCAFDPASAERLLLTIVDRLGAMLPPTRLLAQADRTHLAIWLGPEVDPFQAEAEIAALVYALGDRLIDGEREILPEIAVRSGRFDSSAMAAPSLLSQTLSSFSIPLIEGVLATPASVDLGVQARERFQVEQDLRQAIDRNELRMQFQPLVDARQGRVCGAEALLRWNHPERGLVAPALFVPIMEAADLSHEIGLWALNHAIREARHWRDTGVAGLRVAVNVSGRQVEANDLSVLIERTLRRHGLAGDGLEIELTESVALDEGDRARGLFEALRAIGIRLAIDDFGTGFSSFASLRSIGFDKIKIDRAFVTDVEKRRDNQAICNSILALGRGLGIKVLAEGVESAAEYAWLRNHGCELFQGYYFACPLDSDAFLEFAQDAETLSPLLQAGVTPLSERLRA